MGILPTWCANYFYGTAFGNRNDLKIVTSPKPDSTWMTSPQKLKNLQTLHTLQTAGQVEECPYQVAGLIWPFSKHLSWTLLLPSSLTYLSLICHLNWCKSVSPQFLLLIYMKTEEPIESRHFQGLPQACEFFISWV